jgi:hypothetical protein
MGLSTFVVALVPTYDNIDIWGAVLLTAIPTSPESPGVALHLPSLFWLGSQAKQQPSLVVAFRHATKNKGFLCSGP